MHETGDRYGEAAALTGLAFTWLYLGESERSLQTFLQGLSIRKSIGDLRGEGFDLYGTGWAYALLGEDQKALDHFLQSLLLRQKVGDRRGEALTLTGIGKIYTRQGRYLEALDYFNRSIQILSSYGSDDSADALSHSGWVYRALKQHETALEYFQKALALRRETGDRIGEAATLYGIASVKSEQGQLEVARRYMEPAIALLDMLRASGENYRLRLSYFASIQDYYDFYIRLLMRLHREQPSKGYDVRALEVSEHARARNLIDMMAESEADIRQGVPADLIRRERQLQQRLADAAYRFRILHKADPEIVRELSREINSLKEQHGEALAEIRRSSPIYADLASPKPLKAEEIQRELDEDTLLIEYALGNEASYLWIVTRSSIQSYELPPRNRVESAALRVYRALTARNHNKKGETGDERRERVSRSDNEFAEAASILSNIILGPAVSMLKARRLVIVAQGGLQFIPFGALPVPNGQELASRLRPPLITRHETIYVPSISTLSLLRRGLNGRMAASKTIAIIADPVFSRDDERVRALSPGDQPSANRAMTASASSAATGRQLQRLSVTRWEAEQIKRLVPEEESLMALDFAASRSLVMSPEVKQYRILHLATHAFVDNEHPELSEIVLSSTDEKGRDQNNSLRLYDLFNVRMPVELIVLSACKTAVGKEIPGEGARGFTQMFMYAGAPRVVASFWAIEDKASAELMVRFYKKLLGSERLSPSAALRDAQLDMWREGRWRSPFYWGAFAAQGEWGWNSSSRN
jgi:CHAT domain-containing protein